LNYMIDSDADGKTVFLVTPRLTHDLVQKNGVEVSVLRDDT